MLSINPINGPTTYNSEFAYGLIAYWGLVVIIGISNRAIQALCDRYCPPKFDSLENTGQSKSILSRITRWIRRRLILPLVVGNHRPLPFNSPTRIEGLLIALYVVMNFVFCFPLHKTPPHLKWVAVVLPADPDLTSLYSALHHREQLGQSVAARMANLAIANIPIIWLFATRNPVLIYLTGWSYATFSQFHRWAARTATVLAIAHGTCYSVVRTWQGSYYDIVWHLRFWWCGVVSVISLSILVATSLFFMRKHRYEVFLAIHFVFAIMLLVFLWFHIKFQKGAFNGYIYAAIALWALDRLLRWTRMLWISAVPNLKGVKATVSYDEDVDLVRLDVTDFFKDYIPSPGAYYYIYEPGQLRCYESHPFTMCSWTRPPLPSRNSSSTSSPSTRKDGDLEHGTDGLQAREKGIFQEPAHQEAVAHPRTNAETRHTFLIRPQKGFTDRLRKKMLAIDENRKVKAIRVLIEGPYVCPVPLHRYSTVVMVIGGVGITSVVSKLRSLLATSSSPRLIRLIWTTQRQETVKDVCENELRDVLGHPSLKVDIHITSAQKIAGSETLYAAHTGRPAIEAVLEEERHQCQGSMAVFVCGPKSMEISTRNAVIELTGKEGPQISFYQERFGW